MNGWSHFNLMYFLDFYFTLMFLVGTYRRFNQYRNIGKLAVGGPGRWPKLLSLIHDHYGLFLTWTTILPLALGLGLSVVQLIASRVIWPDAGKPPHGMTLGLLVHHWIALVVVTLLACAMFAVDLYFLIRVGSFDRVQLEKYFDQAEYWLNSPTAHVVKMFTFGYINPRRMVADEVRKALVSAGDLLNTSLWWWNVQITLRFLFGLSLWLTWAFTGGE
jgi:hypothetical protein